MALCDCKIQVCQDLNDKKELQFFGLLLFLAWQNGYWLHEDLNNIKQNRKEKKKNSVERTFLRSDTSCK